MPDNQTSEDPNPSDNSPPKSGGLVSLWAELKRRKVMRVGITYAVVAWLIIQVAATTFGNFGIPVWAFRFVVIMLGLFFPVAILLTWAFELTPEGIKTTKSARERQGDEPVSKEQQRKRNWMALGFAATVPTVVFGALALYFYGTRGEIEDVPGIDRSIAVLPFDNRSERDEDQYFTDGIHDDLLTQISRIKDIKTMSRTSVMAYRDTTKNMKQIGEELGVVHLLEGGVQRAGNRVRINMQLIDARDDSHLWAETYTRELTAENIFEIQSEITEAIAGELRAILSDEEKRRIADLPTDNLEALEAYFKGHTYDYSTDGLTASIERFREAVALDPDFALAQARLAHAYQAQIWYSGLPSEEQIAKAEPHLNRALELDPQLSEAWVVKGAILKNQQKFDDAAKAFEKAIGFNANNSDAYHNYSILLLWNLRNGLKALEMVDKGISLNPDNPDLFTHKADILSRLNRVEESKELWQSMGKRYPDNANVQMQVAINFCDDQGRFDLGLKALRRAHFLDPDNPRIVYVLCDLFDRLGDEENFRVWVERGGLLYPSSEYGPVFRIWSAWIEGGGEASHEAWLSEFEAGFRAYVVGFLDLTIGMNLEDLSKGRPERVLERFRTLVPGFFEADFELPDALYNETFDSLRSLLYITVALRQSGQTERADDLQRRLADKLETDYPSSFTNLALKCLSGKTDEVLEYFRTNPGEPHYRPLSAAFYGNILNEPIIVEWSQAREAWKQEMLDKIEEMEAKGELAPLPDTDALN